MLWTVLNYLELVVLNAERNSDTIQRVVRLTRPLMMLDTYEGVVNFYMLCAEKGWIKWLVRYGVLFFLKQFLTDDFEATALEKRLARRTLLLAFTKKEHALYIYKKDPDMIDRLLEVKCRESSA